MRRACPTVRNQAAHKSPATLIDDRAVIERERPFGMKASGLYMVEIGRNYVFRYKQNGWPSGS